MHSSLGTCWTSVSTPFVSRRPLKWNSLKCWWKLSVTRYQRWSQASLTQSTSTRSDFATQIGRKSTWSTGKETKEVQGQQNMGMEDLTWWLLSCCPAFPWPQLGRREISDTVTEAKKKKTNNNRISHCGCYENFWAENSWRSLTQFMKIVTKHSDVRPCNPAPKKTVFFKEIKP